MLVSGSKTFVPAAEPLGEYPEGGLLMLIRNIRVACCTAAISHGLIPAPSALCADPVQSYECGFQSPEAVTAAIREAVERGEIPDPATRRLPVKHRSNAVSQP